MHQLIRNTWIKALTKVSLPISYKLKDTGMLLRSDQRLPGSSTRPDILEKVTLRITTDVYSYSALFACALRRWVTNYRLSTSEICRSRSEPMSRGVGNIEQRTELLVLLLLRLLLLLYTCSCCAAAVVVTTGNRTSTYCFFFCFRCCCC